MKWLIFIGLKAIEIGLFVIGPYYLALLYYKYGITERWVGKQTFLRQWADGFVHTFLFLILSAICVAIIYGNYRLACYLWKRL